MSKNWTIFLIGTILFFLGISVYLIFKPEINSNHPYADHKTNQPKDPENIEKKPALEQAVKEIRLTAENKKSQTQSKEDIKADDLKNADPPISQSSKIYLLVIIKDEAGLNLEGAKLELIESKSEKVMFNFITNKDGKAELTYAEPSPYIFFNLKISLNGFATKFYSHFEKIKYAADHPLIIILKKGSLMKGFARDTNGNPLEGVEVHLQKRKKTPYQFAVYYDLEVTKTKAGGLFEFPHIENGEVSFAGSGNGYLLLKSQQYAIPNKNEIELIFSKGRSYTIKILDTAGVGIPNANIIYTLYANNQLVSNTCVTDAKGICSLLLPKEKIIQMIISHPYYVRYDTSDRLYSRETEPEIVVLEKGKRLSGVVRDKKTSKPIEGATIKCIGLGGMSSFSITNSLGEYELLGIPENLQNFNIWGVGYKDILDFKLKPNENHEIKLDFELEPSKFCQIKLIDNSTKQPLNNKTVHSFGESGTLRTNENGELNVLVASENSANKIILYIDGYANAEQIIADNQMNIIELFPECKLKIYIKEPTKVPLEELGLQCLGVDNMIYDSQDNCFEIKGLSNGKANLVFAANNFSLTKVEANLVSGEINKITLALEPLVHLIFHLKSTDSTIDLSRMSGRIKYLSEAASTYEDIDLKFNEDQQYFETNVNEDCTKFSLFFLHHLPIADISIQKTPSGICEYNLVLEKGLGIEGEVYDDKGKSIDNALILITPIENSRNDWYDMIFDENYNWLIIPSQTINYENGKFFSYGYTAGKYLIRVSHPDYQKFELQVEISSQSKTNIQIILNKGALISGVVSDTKGVRVSRATICLTLKGIDKINYYYIRKSKTYYTRSDSNGFFLFKNIPLAEYRITVSSSLGNLENLELPVGKDIENLQVKLDEILIVSGIVVDEKDKPIKNVQVFLGSEDEFSPYILPQTTNENGFFSFPFVSNLNYKVSLTYKYKKFEIPLVVKGGDVNIKLVLKNQTDVLIKGNVYEPNGKETSDYALNVYSKEGGYYSSNTEITKTGFLQSINPEGLQEVTIIATAKGFSPGESEPINLSQYSGQPISITLKSNVFIELSIIDLYTRLSIENAFGIIYNSKGSNNTSDSKGKIKIDGLSLGEGILKVMANGYTDKIININITEKNAQIEILMVRGGTIKGILLSDDNKPMPFNTVFITYDQDANKIELEKQAVADDLQINTDENGFFEIKTVPPGNYFVSANELTKFQNIAIFKGFPVTVEEGKETTITRGDLIAFTKTGKINITLTGADVAKKEIKLSKAKATGKVKGIDYVVLNSDLEGKAQFTDIPLGEYIISVEGLAKPINQSIVVKDGSEINLDFPID